MSEVMGGLLQRRSGSRRAASPPQLVVLAAALLAITGGELARADSIEFTNGDRQDKLTIVEAKWDTVEYKLEKAPRPQSVPAERIHSIDRESPVLQRARDTIATGDPGSAVKDLGAISGGSSKSQPWEKAEAGYLLGQAYLLADQPGEAEGAFKAYLEEHRESKDWFVPYAVYGLGEVALASKKPGTAATHFKQLLEFGEKWELLAKFGEGQALLGKGSSGAQAARTLFDEVSKNRRAPPELKEKALVARGRAILLQGNAKGAIRELTQDFFSSSSGSPVTYSEQRAEATLVVGHAYLTLGGKENFEEAEIWLLRVPALYRSHTRIYAESCRLLVDVYGKLGNKKREEEWKARLAALGEVQKAPRSRRRAKPSKKSSKNGSDRSVAHGGGK